MVGFTLAFCRKNQISEKTQKYFVGGICQLTRPNRWSVIKPGNIFH